MRFAVGLGGAGLGFALGGPAGARWGYAIGSLLGSVLFPASPPSSKTPKIKPSQLGMPSSQYGIPVPVIFGTRKVPGNLIWYDNFQAIEITQKVGGGGGMGKGSGGSKKQTVGFEYTVSMAFGLCMSLNPRKTVIKAWQNKEELSLDKFRIYDGSQMAADPHIASFVSRPPVMKNVCYVVFEDFSLGGNTNIPAFQFEVSDVPACPAVNTSQPYTSGSHPADPGYGAGAPVYIDGYLYAVKTESPALIEKIDTADMTLNDSLAMDTDVGVTRPGLKYLGREGEKKLWVVGNEALSSLHFVKFSRIDPDTLTVEKSRFLGDVVLGTDGKKYICWWQHTSSDSTRPITGSWGGNWMLIPDSVAHDDIENWVPGKYYERIGQTISSGGFTYSPRTDRLYFIEDQGGLVEFDPVLMKRTNYVGIGTTAVKDVDADNNYIYLAENKLSGEIWKYDPVNMEKVASWVGPAAGGIIMTMIDGFIYAMEGAGGGGVFKIDTADMSEVGSSAVSEAGAQHDLFPGWGGLVIVDGFNAYRYNLDDFSFICSSAFSALSSGFVGGVYDDVGYYGDLYLTRDGISGNPDNEIYKLESPAGNDVLPPDVTEDVLTNDLYGLGLSSGYLNAGDFNATRAYCTTEDFLVSMVFETEQSVLDVLAYVINHHNGYIRYSNGKISHMQLQASDPVVATITDTELVKEADTLPVQVRKAGHRDISNRVNVEYVKRNRDYVSGVAYQDSITDIDKWGLKPSTVRLDGFCTFARASKIADILLRKSLLNPRGYSFKLGPKSVGFLVGEVITLQDTGVEVNDAVRIGSISEGPNSVLEITSVERIPEVYEFREHGEDTSEPAELPVLFGDAPSVIHPTAVELPALYSGQDTIIAITYERPNKMSWGGTSLYRSYTESGGYVWVESVPQSGITGTVIAVGTDSNGQRYIDVRLDYEDTLISATEFDELITTPLMNLCMFETVLGGGEIYCRYATATLQSVRVWRLTGLIYDTVGFAITNSYGDIAALDKFIFGEIVPYFYTTTEAEKFRTIYYKLASFNMAGEEQLLSDAIMLKEYVDALGDKPLSPTNVKVNGLGIDNTDSLKVSDSGIDMNLEWRSRNRFNTGGQNYTRFDAVADDADFLNFEMEIYKSGVLKRTITQTGKTFNYTAAMQAADAAINTTMDFKLKQNSTAHSSDWKEFALVFV